MEDEPKIRGDIRSELEKFAINGNQAIKFKMIRNTNDLEDETIVFHPEMCHQVFNDGETIFGYDNLSINVHMGAGSLKTYMGIKYKRQIPKGLSDGIEPDDVSSKMTEVLRGGHTTNLDEFSGYIEKEEINFRPMGELVHCFSQSFAPRETNDSTKSKTSNGCLSKTNGNAVVEKSFEVYAVDCVSSPKFNDYLLKMESFVLFYIDAATFLDSSGDEKWRFFTLFEKYKTSEGNSAYAFAGYSSVYQFYVYPDLIRPRIAQMIILPPFQKKGLGVKLLSSIYNHYRSNPKVKEITVEDPSDYFELLRDYVDAMDCKKLSSYVPEKLKKGFSFEMAEETHRVLKMTKRQAHRVYEILRLQITNIHNEDELKQYRLDVKRRLNIPYQKQESDIKRMIKRKSQDAELNKAAALDDNTRKTELESNFQLLLTHYRDVLARLEKYD